MSSRRYTTAQENFICAQYETGLSSEIIARHYRGTVLDDGGVPPNGGTVRHTLKRLGVALRPAAHERNPVVTDEQREHAVNLCQNGLRLEDAAREAGVCKSIVSKALREAGIQLAGGRPRSCAIDDHAFDELTPECLYWIGFLFADGHIHEAGDGSAGLVVGLSAVDRRHLEKLRAFLKSTHAISSFPPKDRPPIRKGGPIVHSGPSVYFHIRSQGIFDSLRARGMVTKAARIPPPELANSRDFWRGAVDGDGCLQKVTEGTRYPSIDLAGQLPFVEEYVRFLTREGMAKLNPYPNAVDGVWVVKTSGRTAVDIIRHLYADASMFLDRKRILAESITCDIDIETATQRLAPVVSVEDVAFRALQDKPFPYPVQRSITERINTVNRLVALAMNLVDKTIQPASHAGIALCAPYFPNRFDAIRKGKVSAFDAWHTEHLVRRAIRLQQSSNDSVEPDGILRALMLDCRTPSIFRPAVATFIYRRYCQPGDRVWDPCAGYGGRLLGAHTACVRYVGTDVDEKTVEGNRELARDIGADATIHCVAAEDFTPPSVSLVFTSPPYFDRERYSDDENQSWQRYSDIETWLNYFIGGVARRALDALPTRGHLVLNVTNIVEHRKVIPIVERSIGVVCASGFRHVETLRMPIAAINRTAKPSEPILVFSKK